MSLLLSWIELFICIERENTWSNLSSVKVSLISVPEQHHFSSENSLTKKSNHHLFRSPLNYNFYFSFVWGKKLGFPKYWFDSVLPSFLTRIYDVGVRLIIGFFPRKLILSCIYGQWQESTKKRLISHDRQTSMKKGRGCVALILPLMSKVSTMQTHKMMAWLLTSLKKKKIFALARIK